MELDTTTDCLYEIIDGNAKIIACRSYDNIAVIPASIEGYPVTELAAYAFSEGRREPLRGRWMQEGKTDSPPLLQGDRLIELHLPSTVFKLGRYAFYNCMKWEKFYFYSSVTDIGAGVFTGCKGLRFMDVTVVPGGKSGLQEILFELHQLIRMTYHDKAAAKLIFPEFYEEAIENTPARLLVTKTHGCGHSYRYCFYGTEFQFKDYDSLLYHLTVQESEKLVSEAAIGRLQYPFQLSESARQQYLAYLENHKHTATELVIQSKDMGQLRWFLERIPLNRQELDTAVDLAANSKNTEALSYLMDYRHRNFKPIRAKFVL